ncbi:MAG: protein kinase [Archangium sp.]|nr:protein kinase [Archangium sp.]
MSDGAKLEALGHLEKALTAYVAERQWDGAVRLAMSLNRQLDAARYCLQAQRHWDAAVCFQRGGAQKECLAALVQVTPANARYRDACVHAVRVAQSLGTPLDSMSSWFMPFISYAPTSPGEAGAMKELAEAFARGEKVRLATSIYRSVLQAFPKDADAAERLAVLSAREPRPSSPSSPGTPSTPLPAPPMTSTASGVVRALKPKLSDLLIAKGLVSQSQVDRLLREQPEVGRSESVLAEALSAANLVSELDVIRTLSESCGIAWISDEDLLATSTPEAAKGLTLELAERWKVAPIKLVDRQLHLAMPDPRDVALVDKLRFSTGLKIVGVFATAAGIRRTVGKLYHGEDPDRSEVTSWHGQLLDPSGGSMPLEPFSDRYTGTREHTFDTGEFERPAAVPAPAPAAEAAAKKGATIDLPRPPTVGSRFAGRYQLEALIGEGGSASVYRAMDMELNEHVAIKLFSPATAAEAETMVARFKLELSLSRLLSHPNIIRLFDLGSQGQWRYLTMELLDGKDVASLMNERGQAFGIGEGLKLLEQVCTGLQAAHERGVVHRDIKPHNLFVTTQGEVKVMDFGIARKLNSPGVTVVGTIAGTPEYMSPEQINGFSDVTHTTDLYALGITAYQMFTGVLPFERPELTALLIAQATEAPPLPTSKNPGIPLALEALLLRLLEKDPARRPASAAEVGATLRSIRTSLGRPEGRPLPPEPPRQLAEEIAPPVPSYMLSVLGRQRQLLGASRFLERYPCDWLVREPGPWNPARSVLSSNTEKTHQPSRLDGGQPMGDDALCFELRHAPGVSVTLGRSTENSIVVNDLTVSREQFLLQFVDRTWVVRSRGTPLAVDGVAVGEAGTPLKNAAVISAGDVRMTFYSPAGFTQRLEEEDHKSGR